MSNANPNDQTQGNQPDRDRPDQPASRAKAANRAIGRLRGSPARPVPMTKGGRGRADSHCREALRTRGRLRAAVP